MMASAESWRMDLQDCNQLDSELRKRRSNTLPVARWLTEIARDHLLMLRDRRRPYHAAYCIVKWKCRYTMGQYYRIQLLQRTIMT